MADNNRFSASARIPTRPLSIENKDMAQPKEVLVDYKNHELYVVDEDSKLVNVTASVDTVIKQMEDNFKEDPSMITGITIRLPSGQDITIEQNIINFYNDIVALKGTVSGLDETVTNNKEALDGRIDGLNNTVSELSGTVSGLGETVSGLGETVTNNNNTLTGRIDGLNSTVSELSGKVNEQSTANIDASRITQNDNLQFVTNAQKTEWSGKADIVQMTAIIKSGKTNWTEDGGPYYQVVNISGMKSEYNPIVDIRLSDNYETAMKELENYSYIYRITTTNGGIRVYSIKPTEISITIVMKIDK